MRLVRRMVIAAIKRAGLVEPAVALRDSTWGALVSLRRVPAERAHRSLLARHPDLLLGYDDGRWEVARRDDRLVARDVMADNLDMVADALERLDIPYFVFPTAPDHERFRIGVPTAWRRATLGALAAAGDPAIHLYLEDAGSGSGRRRIPLGQGFTGRARGRALRSPMWRVYVSRTDAGGRAVLGHRHGCEVEFWSESGAAAGSGGAAGAGTAPARVLRAQRWNRYATELPDGVTATGTVQVRERTFPAVRELTAAPHFQRVTFPIDLVYTWVDGGDPAWLQRKNVVLRELDAAETSQDAYDVSRYRSRDELRYSLRSVAMFADFVRHIYVVTDDQVPPWLNTDHPRVTVVAHKEIFRDAGKLPTFNSHAIETRLHHIDGLAEHYLYLNDDFLFCRTVSPETFFLSNGLVQFFPSNALIGLGDGGGPGRSVDDAARNSQELIHVHFGRAIYQKMKHAPYPQRRSVLYEAEDIFAEEFDRTAASQFRSPSDLPVASAFSHYYGYLTGRAIPGSIVARYVELGADDFDRKLRALRRRHNSDTLCINDAAADDTPDLSGRERRLREFLETYWPVKSEFER